MVSFGLNSVLILPREDSLVRQKYFFYFVISQLSDEGFLCVRGTQAGLMQICWLTRPICIHMPISRPICIYGGPAYPHSIHIQASFRQNLLTP